MEREPERTLKTRLQFQIVISFLTLTQLKYLSVKRKCSVEVLCLNRTTECLDSQLSQSEVSTERKFGKNTMESLASGNAPDPNFSGILNPKLCN